MTTTPQPGNACELPAYQSHKIVHALKISAIRPADPTPICQLESFIPWQDSEGESLIGAIITPAEEGYREFGVTIDYVVKHKPEVGGYFVLYEDGYKSFSPAKAFEEGYTRL